MLKWIIFLCLVLGRNVRIVRLFCFILSVMCLLMLLVNEWIGNGFLYRLRYMVLKLFFMSRKIVLLRFVYSCSNVGWYSVCMLFGLLVCVVSVKKLMFSWYSFDCLFCLIIFLVISDCRIWCVVFCVRLMVFVRCVMCMLFCCMLVSVCRIVNVCCSMLVLGVLVDLIVFVVLMMFLFGCGVCVVGDVLGEWGFCMLVFFDDFIEWNRVVVIVVWLKFC